MKIQKRGYQHYYVSQDDIPKDLGADTAIIYETPTRIYGYDDLFSLGTFNIKGINYQNINKENLTHNLVFCWKQIENLKREFASEKIKNEILTKRLADYNIQTSLTPDEIEDYEFMLSEILTREIQKITEEPNVINMKEEITNRVRTELAKVEYDTKNSYKYNIVRINNALKYNDILLDNVLNSKSRDLSIKDRSKLVLDIQKANRDNIAQLKEICKELGINFRDTQAPPSNSNTENTVENTQAPSSNKIDLGSFLK